MTVRLPADVAGIDRRAVAAEPSVTHELAAWYARLLAAVSVPVVLDALRSGSVFAIDNVLQAVPLPQLPLRTPALKEARRVLRLISGGRQPDLIRLGLDIRDPKFFQAVDEHGARLVREVDASVRQAIRETIADGYRLGVHPYEIAPVIRETVGLTARQARSVVNQSRAMLDAGTHPAIVERRAQVYGDLLRRRRARMIARTETLRALNVSRVAGIQQAADHGLIDRETATLVWVANPDACDECQGLDGETAPIDVGFPDGPPAHRTAAAPSGSTRTNRRQPGPCEQEERSGGGCDNRCRMVRFDVKRFVWGCEDVPYAGGVHEIDDPSPELLRGLAAAQAAGVVEVLDGDVDDSHVQSQEDGEAAYQAAQESGEWQVGNLMQHELDQENPDAPTAEVA